MRRTVFLSSTGKDLARHRRAVIDHLAKLDHFLCDAQENFGARDASAVPFCRLRVREADILVALIGQYRGWEPPGDAAQRSITEMEYDWAGEAPAKTRLIYVSPDSLRLPGPETDDPGEAQRQARFRVRLMGAHIVDQACFGSPRDLAAAVGAALANHVIGELVLQAVAHPQERQAIRSDPFEAAAQAVAEVAEDESLDPAEMARQGIDVAEIERRVKRRAEAHEAMGRDEFRQSARYYRQMGALAFLHDTDRALRAYAKAAELDPDDAEGWVRLGQLQMRGGYLAAAKASFERLIALGNSIDDPRVLHWAHMLLGDAEAALGNRTPALVQYERASDLIKALTERDPANAEWQRDLSVSYERVGDIRSARGDRDGALASYEDGLRIAKALTERDPANAEWQRDLSVSYNKIGDIRSARGDRDGALASYEDGLRIRKALAERDPANAEWQADLVVSAWKLAESGAPNACAHLRNGLAILTRLDSEDRLTADQKGWIAGFEAAIAARCG